MPKPKKKKLIKKKKKRARVARAKQREEAAKLAKKALQDPEYEGDASPVLRKIARAKSKEREAPDHEFKPSHTQKKPFSWDLAEQYINIQGLPGERNVEQSHVEFLASEMEHGRFIMAKAGIDVAVCQWDGERRKLNGQHTCWARLEMDHDWQPLIVVNEWKVQNEDEARQLYARFDRNKERSRRHITNISLVGTPEFEGVGTTVLAKLAQGLRFWKEIDPAFDTKDPEAIAQALRSDKFNGVAHRCIPVMSQMHQAGWGHMRRAPVYGALFETFAKFKVASDAFWQRVGDGVGVVERGDPARWLKVFLDTHVLHSGAVSKQKKPATNFDVYNACVTCFNDHKAGRLRRTVPKKCKNWVKAR